MRLRNSKKLDSWSELREENNGRQRCRTDAERPELWASAGQGQGLDVTGSYRRLKKKSRRGLVKMQPVYTCVAFQVVKRLKCFKSIRK